MAAHQAPPSLGLSKQEHWSGLPFPSPMHESEKWKWSRSVVSHSLWPHGLQPSRLLHPWDFPSKSTGVGCHFLLQFMKVKSESEVAQLCPTLSNPMDCSLPGSSVKYARWQYTGLTYSFSKFEQSIVPCPVLTVASCPAYRFLRRQVKWSVIPISLRIFQFVVIHTVKGFSVVNEAEVDVLLESSCFFYDLMDVGDLISGSSAFSKSSLYFWKFSVHIPLKTSLKVLENFPASMRYVHNCEVVWIFLALLFWGLEWTLTF